MPHSFTTMEEALLSLQHDREKRSEEKKPAARTSSSDSSKNNSRAACLAFARALRDLALAANKAPPSPSNRQPSSVNSVARLPTSPQAKEEEEEALTASWLLNLCSTVPSELGSLQLALAVLAACNHPTEEEIQTALFDALGAEERAMEVMFELAPRAAEIRDSPFLTENALRRQAAESDTKEGTRRGRDDLIGETLVDVEEERRQLLLQEAREAANIAAAAKAAISAPSMSGPASTTHTVVRASDKQAQKFAKKAAKRAAAALAAAKEAGAIIDENELGGGIDLATLRLEQAHADEKVGLDGMTREDIWNMQHSLAPEGTRTYYDKLGLPPGTEREVRDGYEAVIIPAPVRDASKLHPRIRLADVMNTQCRKAFAGTESLNPMQSTVFETAFHTQENMLICAPTGAGKTNVAMLTVVAHFRDKGIIRNDDDPYAAYAHIDDHTNTHFTAGRKVIYIAPMKALAQEVVDKFSSKLKPLGLIVRELTGDMQLTRAEADSSDVIVTTPEKWDVVTRKGGDGSLGQTCGLLIIDEVHLLADERGAVIESVVARLHRLVESSQRQVRIVGLSATLPNYEDVATFLRADVGRGLFYFGPEYRPVPLQQQFIGVTDVKDRFRREKKMNDVCYEIVTDSLQRGHQVMVFVHSRKGTGETARALTDRAMMAGDLDRLFLTVGTEQYGEAHARYADKAAKSRNKEVADLFQKGAGIHHAGMLRNDRKLTEQMFADGAIKVLCCTATLAWGINLPAHTVVVKGTEVYNPEKGGSVDLSILDVMQIFGRAGRPQFDSSGEATLITSHDALARYLRKLVMTVPIESNFIKQLPDHLNAEVVGGTVTNIPEAATWLAYTYLYTRMVRNPLAYGISADEKEDDPRLRNKCLELVTDAAKMLDEQRMLRYDPQSGNLAVTDLGRVASHFYIRAESVATFNELLEKFPYPTDADLCHIICYASEFENVKVRSEELDEIDKLLKKNEACPLEIKAPVEEFSGKSCVLLQTYISREKVNSFTLISDTNYVASNAGRVARALFEMCLKRGNAGAAVKLLRLAKSIDRRLWWFQTPLRQFESELPNNVYRALESRVFGAESGYDSFEAALSLLDMQPEEVGQFIHWFKGGEKVQWFIRKLPRLEINCDVKPVTRGILRFRVDLEPVFDWHGRWHGGAEGFWLWVEDGENHRIYHHEYILFSRRTHPEPLALDMTIPAFDPLPPQYFVRVVSDSWVGCEFVLPLSFRDLMLPEQKMPYTDLFDLTPLPTSALREPKFEQLYKFETFNPIQTQLFHILYHTDTPVLLGAPTGSGKTIVAELALLRMKRLHPRSKCVYVAPLKSLARERLKEWKSRLGSPPLNWSVLELSGDTRHDRRALNNADVLVCTPEKWDLITRGWRGNSDSFSDSNVSNGKKFVKDVRLLIIDEIHLLGEERGAVLEAIVSRTRFISKHVQEERRRKSEANSENKEDVEDNIEVTRILGLSTAFANPYDLADWIGIDAAGTKRGLYNFRPSVRPIPMEVHIQGFPGRHYCPRMATMNKPCYAAIKEHSPTKPTIIFVASRRQTRLTALDLISYAVGDENPQAFLGCSDDYVASVASTINDAELRHTLTFGVGLHHAGLSSHDRETVEKMFLSGDIQVLVATATLAWGVNLPAHLVIVKGTEFFDGKTSRYVDYPVTDVLQMIGRAGRPQFDKEGIAVVMVEESKKNFYKKFLYEPFPVESRLVERMCENLNAEIAIGTISSVVDAVGYLSWTFFARRAKVNPSFYGAKTSNPEDLDEFFFSLVKDSLSKLVGHGCVALEADDASLGDDSSVFPTVLGQAASNYYLKYRTPKQMREGAREVRKILTQRLESSKSDQSNEERSSGKSNTEVNPWSLPAEVETPAVAHLLCVLSKTHEFDELPVRHNEEHLNAELNETLPWGPDTRDVLEGKKVGHSRNAHNDIDLMADPHTKCFLLLQAYILRARLPISDYINDTKSALDQVPRLLAAMQYISLDDSATGGSFELMCLFSRVRQILNTRTMVDDDPINQIPGMPKDGARRIKSRGASSIDRNVSSLRDLRCLPTADAAKLLKWIHGGRNGDKNHDAAMDFLSLLPLISVDRIEVKSDVDKSTGMSSGTLSFDLVIEERGAGNLGNKRDHNADSGMSCMLVLGSAQNSVLLSHKSVGVSNGLGPSRNQEVEMKFDWSMANANGGAGGGSMILRIINEDIRGMDVELRVPLRPESGARETADS